jgi:hypothetical protein
MVRVALLLLLASLSHVGTEQLYGPSGPSLGAFPMFAIAAALFRAIGYVPASQASQPVRLSRRAIPSTLTPTEAAASRAAYLREVAAENARYDSRQDEYDGPDDIGLADDEPTAALAGPVNLLDLAANRAEAKRLQFEADWMLPTTPSDGWQDYQWEVYWATRELFGSHGPAVAHASVADLPNYRAALDMSGPMTQLRCDGGQAAPHALACVAVASL